LLPSLGPLALHYGERRALWKLSRWVRGFAAWGEIGCYDRCEVMWDLLVFGLQAQDEMEWVQYHSWYPYPCLMVLTSR